MRKNPARKFLYNLNFLEDKKKSLEVLDPEGEEYKLLSKAFKLYDIAYNRFSNNQKKIVEFAYKRGLTHIEAHCQGNICNSLGTYYRRKRKMEYIIERYIPGDILNKIDKTFLKDQEKNNNK
ncbi:hypothetical protein [Natronospora cellulosivora (SeqCode)]